MQKPYRVVFILSILLVLSSACGSIGETAITPTIAPTKAEPEGATVTTWFVVSEQADVHSCASADCAVIMTVTFSRRLVVLETVNGWHRIRLAAGENGWIEAAFTSQTAVCRSCW